MHQGADTVFPDGEGHGPESTDWRKAHNHVDDAEDHLRETFDDVKNELAFAPETMQRKAKQHGKHQYLKDIAAGKGADDAAGDNIQQEGDNALFFRLLGVDRYRMGIQGRRVDVHSGAGLHHVNNNQADNQRCGTDHFEIE